MVQVGDEVWEIQTSQNCWIGPTGEEQHELMRKLFQQSVTVIILTYDVSSMESFRKLWNIYSNLPRPDWDPFKQGDKKVVQRERNLKRKSRLAWDPFKQSDRKVVQREENLKRKIIVDRRFNKDGSAILTTVDAETFPMLIVGCPTGGQKEVKQADIERFIGSHPNCIFAGECDVDKLEEVEAVYGQAIEIVRALRLRAAPPRLREKLVSDEGPETSLPPSKSKGSFFKRIFKRS
jgi:hypothetical protein